MTTYWDTSCVLKLYCRENDSAKYLGRVAKSTSALVSSVLMTSELVFALYQKEARNEIKSGAADRLSKKFLEDISQGRFQLIPFGEDVREEAHRMACICYHHSPVLPLRTLDGLHLATAKLSGCQEILTTDKRMRTAASLFGMMPEAAKAE